MPAIVPHPVSVPHPIIIPSGHHHGGNDITWPWIAGYVAVAIAVWIVAAIALARQEKAELAAKGYGPPDKDSAQMAVLGGAAAAVFWPMSAVAAVVWLILRRFTREDPPKSWSGGYFDADGRPTDWNHVPLGYAQMTAAGWNFCDGCRTWSQATQEKPHKCRMTYIKGPFRAER